jgi:hypothetical protein
MVWQGCENFNPYFNRNGDHHAYLGVKKIADIIRGMLDVGSKLKSLKLSFEDEEYYVPPLPNRLNLSSIPTQILTKAFSKLDEFALEYLKMDSKQLNSVFEVSFGNLTCLSFREIPMDVTQTVQLLRALGKTCKLKSLELSELDARETPSGYFAQVINKIERVVLQDIMIEAFQIEDIFLAIIRDDSVMKNFVLEQSIDYHIDISEVDAEVRQ